MLRKWCPFVNLQYLQVARRWGHMRKGLSLTSAVL